MTDKTTVPSCIVKSNLGATSLSIDGNSYQADKDGQMEIAQVHLSRAQEHGFALVAEAKHTGKIEILATGHVHEEVAGTVEAIHPSDDKDDQTDTDDAADYTKLSKKELLALAEERGVEVKSKATIEEIIAALTEADAAAKAE